MHNCDDQSCLHIFLHSSNIWSFTYSFVLLLLSSLLLNYVTYNTDFLLLVEGLNSLFRRTFISSAAKLCVWNCSGSQISIQVNIWKITYLNCGERYEDMIDRRSYAHNLSSCEIKAWKKIKAWTGFKPMTSATPVHCSTNWTILYFEKFCNIYQQDIILPPKKEN